VGPMAEISELYCQFAANLVQLREAAGLSPEELAFCARIDPTRIGGLEGGHGPVMLGTLIDLAGALGLTLEDLLDGITWDPAGSAFLDRPDEADGDG
jgi:transcriptional regulator with XRE-family HTH domain